eukprot:TRINITY_DN2912_c0_g1_i3.p1 TRINITY_DN2912_c0_g1~~TRINITY_DN2912_c0_g1_i3.p1  ORF type:complete len:102 (-),score=29.33 TRINITY_DN2912_c0_g1_i3:191-496(-)
MDVVLSEQGEFESNFTILPSVLNLLKLIQSSNDDMEVSKSVASLKEKINGCKILVDEMPGVQLTNLQQSDIYKDSQQRLSRKTELIEQYLQLDLFNSFKST